MAVVFHKREVKLALNEVNSGNLQYAAATLGDYDLYNVGQAVTIKDHIGNTILDGYIKDKTRSSGVLVSLYIEDAGQFLRDHNVEDSSPEDDEPIFDTVRNVLQNYILPASWALDTAAMPDDTALEWPVAYAVRNGTALKHVNNICEMLSVRWTANWRKNLQNFALQLYPLISPASVSESYHDLTEYKTTTAFKAGDSSRHFITQIQVIGAEPEVSQKIAYSQADTTDVAYLASSDTYCRSLDLSAATTIVEVMHGDILSGWETAVSTYFKFNHDNTWYSYDYYDGNAIRGVIAYPSEPWKALDPATISSTGLALSHATNDDMYLIGAMVVDRPITFSPATTWMWVGSEVVGFESADTYGGNTRFIKLTRGLNGVRYIHRQGTRVRPYYEYSVGATAFPDANLFKVGTLSNSISMSGFAEMDGLDKVADGVLKAATVMYTGSTQKLTATLDASAFYPGLWVNTTPASVLQKDIRLIPATDCPSITMVKSVSYSLGTPLTIEFGTNIPTIVRNSKEAVTAFDLVMQRPSQSRAGTVLEYSDNKVAALMKFSKNTSDRIKPASLFDGTEDTNYLQKWVRLK